MNEREGDKVDRSTANDDAQYSDSPVHRKIPVHRRVPVRGSEGVSATVVVKAQRGKVWMSIEPPFTDAAIMEPSKVDEVIRTLVQAADDAKKMVGGI